MKYLLLLGLFISSGVYSFDQPAWCSNGKKQTKAEQTTCADETLAKQSIELDNKWDAYKKNTPDKAKVDQGKKYLKKWNKTIFQPCDTNKLCLQSALETVLKADLFKSLSSENSVEVSINPEVADTTLLVDLKQLVGADKKTVSKLLGEANGCEPSKYGEKCSYDKLEIEIVYVNDKANFITINDLGAVDYNDHVIEHLGLNPAEPTTIGSSYLFWKNQQGLLEIKVFKGAEGKVFYAYIKAFADYEEAATAASTKGNKAVEGAESTQDSNTLPLTVSEFEQRFKNYNIETGIGLSLNKVQTETGAVGRKLSRYDFSEAVMGLIVEYLESNNQLTSVVFIAGGDSEKPLKAVANMLSAMVGIIAAIDPSLSKDQRADLVMKKLGVSDLKIGESSSYQNNGIDYSYQVNELMGFILTISKVE